MKLIIDLKAISDLFYLLKSKKFNPIENFTNITKKNHFIKTKY